MDNNLLCVSAVCQQVQAVEWSSLPHIKMRLHKLQFFFLICCARQYNRCPASMLPALLSVPLSTCRPQLGGSRFFFFPPPYFTISLCKYIRLDPGGQTVTMLCCWNKNFNDKATKWIITYINRRRLQLTRLWLQVLSRFPGSFDRLISEKRPRLIQSTDHQVFALLQFRPYRL